MTITNSHMYGGLRDGIDDDMDGLLYNGVSTFMIGISYPQATEAMFCYLGRTLYLSIVGEFSFKGGSKERKEEPMHRHCFKMS